MNFQQLKIIKTSARLNFNLTAVGNALFTTQSAISKQIKELETELGVDVFRRHGKRILGFTEAGEHILHYAERILLDGQNIKRIAEEHIADAQGRFVIATTHTQARYRLPKIVTDFKLKFPHIEMYLHQGSPREIADLLLSGDADLAIATEVLADQPELVCFPFYTWQHKVIAPHHHPLAVQYKQTGLLTLQDVAQYPIITYHDGFTGRGRIDRIFSNAGLSIDVVMAALDADVIKTYVEMGLGIGIVSSVSLCHELEQHGNAQWAILSVQELDAHQNTTLIALHHRHFLRHYMYEFLHMCSEQLTRTRVDELLHKRYQQMVD